MGVKEFRVSEIFGPTIQGEGRRAGTACHFIRFAGCDYRCSWCDSPHAVLPVHVVNTPKLTEDEIVKRVSELPGKPNWVVLSGGNPLLFDLGELVLKLRVAGFYCMVETQGTVEKEWVTRVPEVCISPKPPSSGNLTSPQRIENFFKQWDHVCPPRSTYYPYLKVVVFDDEDYEYAREMYYTFEGHCDFYVSVGTMSDDLPTVAHPERKPYKDPEHVRNEILTRTRWLFEKVAHDPNMKHVRVSPQLHTLVWGNERGR